MARLLIDYFVGPDAVIILAGDDTLCRKSGWSLFGAGMRHDPLISSRAMKLVSWGHDWVNRCLIVVNPWWAPGKVFALPILMRLYRNKQGVTKAKGGGKKKAAPSTKRKKKQAKRKAAKKKPAKHKAKKKATKRKAKKKPAKRKAKKKATKRKAKKKPAKRKAAKPEKK